MSAAADLRIIHQLTTAGIRERTGTGLLTVLAIGCFTVCSWLAFTVAGGTWMFYQRWTQLPNYLDTSVLALENPRSLLILYFALAIVTCGLLAPVVATLAANAATMGSYGRAERLAVLRLLGVSRARMVRLAVYETLVQMFVGTLLGLGTYLLTTPLWGHLEFQFTPVRATEMLLPWWGYPLVMGAMLVISCTATVWALREVIVSPLGVARRNPPKALSRNRILYAALLVVAAVVISTQHRSYIGIAVVSCLMVMGIVAANNLLAPFLLQLIARLCHRLPGTSWQVAMRRVQRSATLAWGRVNALVILVFLLGWFSTLPDGNAADNPGPVWGDIRQGLYLTVAACFFALLWSTLLSRISTVFQERPLHSSLQRMGVTPGFALRLSLWETAMPMVACALLSYSFGALCGLVIVHNSIGETHYAPLGMIVILAGFILVLAMVVAVHPLRVRLLAADVARRVA